jgi:hypothetical protein
VSYAGEAPGLDSAPLHTKRGNCSLRSDLLLEAHLLEILSAQVLNARKSILGIDFEFAGRLVALAARSLRFIEQHLRKPAMTSLFPLFFRRPADLGKQELDELLDHFRPTPENMERMLENGVVLVAFHENGMQRRMKIILTGEATGLSRFQRIEHLPRSYRQTRPSKHAGEMHDVLGKPAARSTLP